MSRACARAGVLVVASEQEADDLRPELEAYERAQAEEYWNSRDLAFENLRRRGQSAQPSMRTFVGTPDQVLRHLEPTLKGCRDTHLIGGNRAHHATDGMVRYQRSVELYLKEVAPVLRTWGRQPVRDQASTVATRVATVV